MGPIVTIPDESAIVHILRPIQGSYWALSDFQTTHGYVKET